MGKTYFVTGTDTDAGKTVVTCGLLEAARQQGLSTLGLKPVAAGSQNTEAGWRNEDALALMEAMTLSLPYEQVNPFTLEPPIAPHIAAREAGITVTVDRLVGYCRGAMMHKNDFTLIEGAGGWRVPLNHREMLSDLARAMDIPVILVVGMKLGCISHALLTAESIVRDGVKLAGWVANRIDPEMSRYKDNVETLKAMLPVPCLGEVPWLASADKTAVAGCLDISQLIS